MSPNARLAGTALGHLAGLGLRDFVVCAGARNAPLVNSLLASCQEKTWTVRHHFDERTAAFFALGLAKKNASPVAVLTTSGTAVAELFPAVIEAYYSGIPLVLVTADRPVAYRGSGAPQAIEQAGIFGLYAPLSLDISIEEDLAAVAAWEKNAPLHLNLCFDEPTPGDVCREWEEREFPSVSSPDLAGEEPGEEFARFCQSADRPVVLLGELPPDWRPEVEKFLFTSGVPLWAEAGSGLRESPLLAKQQIRSEYFLTKFPPRQVLRLGGVPSLRFWRDLEDSPDIAVFSLSPRPFSGLARESQLFVSARFPGIKPMEKEGWADDLTLLADAAPDKSLTKHPFSEPGMVRELSRRIPPEALVFLGNSLPIREWNLAATRDCPHPRSYASRGANGIDGQIATFLGLSEGEEESWGVFGDLTALCDLNAPALLEQLSAGRRRLVILNNAGGRIFSRLPSLAGLPDAHKKITENRHTRNFEPWAKMWGLDYRRWSAGEPFPEVAGPSLVIEVIPDPAATEAFWEDLS